MSVSNEPAEEPRTELAVYETDVVEPEKDYSIAANAWHQSFLKLEAEYLTAVKKGEISIDPTIGVDVVICWQIQKRQNLRSLKQGFFAYFGLKVLGTQLSLTEA